jgi:signal transduction histidine kinase
MPGGGTLTISLRMDPDAVAVEVRDTGPGISPENLERVFYPYFTTKERGTGFGLAIAYRIVEEHGGSMSAASPPDGGARFTVRLPTPIASAD